VEPADAVFWPAMRIFPFLLLISLGVVCAGCPSSEPIDPAFLPDDDGDDDDADCDDLPGEEAIIVYDGVQFIFVDLVADTGTFEGTMLVGHAYHDTAVEQVGECSVGYTISGTSTDAPPADCSVCTGSIEFTMTDILVGEELPEGACAEDPNLLAQLEEAAGDEGLDHVTTSIGLFGLVDLESVADPSASLVIGSPNSISDLVTLQEARSQRLTHIAYVRNDGDDWFGLQGFATSTHPSGEGEPFSPLGLVVQDYEVAPAEGGTLNGPYLFVNIPGLLGQ